MVVKCLNKLSTYVEISGSHVASLLLGYEDKYASHTFKNLNVHHFINSVSNDIQEATNEAEDANELIQWGNDG